MSFFSLSVLTTNSLIISFSNSYREVVEDEKELLFDHGAPFFNANKTEVLGLVHEWESKGLVACWKEKFGFFDRISNKFFDLEQVCKYCFNQQACFVMTGNICHL